jgi:2-pyrone-4,6-dicarboxylate lactonase
MPSATIERALHMHRTLGLQRGVIVQPTTYGADHQATLDGIAAAGPDYRGCANAAVFDEATDADLDNLHAGGVRGARFSRQSLGIALTPQALPRRSGASANSAGTPRCSRSPRVLPSRPRNTRSSTSRF